jgi:hypothetical protein
LYEGSKVVDWAMFFDSISRLFEHVGSIAGISVAGPGCL